MSIRKVNRSDPANGPWVVNNMHDNQEKYYIFKYKCPDCGAVANVRLPLKSDTYLDIGWIVTCNKCGRRSSPARNKICICEIYRCFDENVRESELAEHNSNIFVDAVSACAAIVINADNVVKREEIREYKEFCQAFFTDNLEYAKDRLKFYLANNDKAYVVIEKLKNAKPELKDLLLELLCEIASCDGDFAKCEQDVIDKLVYNLSISSSKWHELKEKYAQTGEEYKILGVSSSASFNEIKAAYHKKCKEFHPDLYQNLPQSFQDFANQKFKEVQEAYEKLRMRYE